MTNKNVFRSGAGALFFSVSLLAPAFLQGAQTDRPAAPDNTAVNKRDQKSGAPTADQGKNNLSDRELARRIRRDVVADKNLSTYGHNVKIIAQGGKVTLKGPVHSEDEKKAVEDHAHRHAGEGNVISQLAVEEDRK